VRCPGDAVPADELIDGDLDDATAEALHVDALARRQIDQQRISAVAHGITRQVWNAVDAAAPAAQLGSCNQNTAQATGGCQIETRQQLGSGWVSGWVFSPNA
jgi:hypothetical protein